MMALLCLFVLNNGLQNDKFASKPLHPLERILGMTVRLNFLFIYFLSQPTFSNHYCRFFKFFSQAVWQSGTGFLPEFTVVFRLQLRVPPPVCFGGNFVWPEAYCRHREQHRPTWHQRYAFRLVSQWFLASDGLQALKCSLYISLYFRAFSAL